MEKISILVIAVVLDLIFGDPVNIPHPISYIGKMIHSYEKGLRKSSLPLRLCGFLLLLLSTSTVVLLLTGILFLANRIHPWLHYGITVYLVYTALAATCLNREVRKVYIALKEKKLPEARRFISYLVGRDTTNLTEHEITRAAVETAAENTVDGVLAPLMFLFVGLLLDVPVQAVFLYKTINTLDSMVGYMQEPYREIGFFSAKTDDIANYIPARIGSLFMVLGGGLLGFAMTNGLKIVVRDRRNHKSPNCGYPESAVAGLLQIQMGGTNTYFNEVVVKPTMGDPIQPLQIDHILQTIHIMYASELCMVVTYIVILWLI
jgi:adenosylcobinamide-phosphate synthase